MTPLYTKEQFINAKSNDELMCQCEECNNPFLRKKKYIKHELLSLKGEVRFCSISCHIKNKQGQKQTVTCLHCNKKFLKFPSKIKTSPNHFCSSSCAASYNNTHKSHGYRRSKLEMWLESQLTTLYPSLEIHFNRKDAINSELDIYIPSLNLAFELNGIFHYEPIYGSNTLSKIQNNDNNKYQACIEAKINLCIIDASQQKYFKESTSQQYLNIITNIINERLLTS